MPLYGMQPAGFPGFSVRFHKNRKLCSLHVTYVLFVSFQPLAAFPLTEDLQMLQRMTIQVIVFIYDVIL